MDLSVSRREVLQTAALGLLAALPSKTSAGPLRTRRETKEGWISGNLTGAEALVATLQHEGVQCVYGIPGAQNNELWDTMKSKGLPYLLCTHEFSAAAMADGYARSTGKPGVLCIVPGPGLTNALTGLGEARLDSVPIVCIVTDVACGAKHHPFQVHDLPHLDLLRPLVKGVYSPRSAAEIPCAVLQAFQSAEAGEPGPAAVLVPYPFFIESHAYHVPPLPDLSVPFDEAAFQTTLALLSNRNCRVGIYAGFGCMDFSADLVRAAEILQAPVATSVSGKGAIPENHPLSVGWGYGPQGTRTAEAIFKQIDLVLAVGVRYSEVSTANYAIPAKSVIQVDSNASNLGAVVKNALCVHADAGLFLAKLNENSAAICRPANSRLANEIGALKHSECKVNGEIFGKCGTDPMAFVLALRRCLNGDALVFVDVTATEHYAAEAFTVCQPRTYFNPTDNQSMGWSIPAAIGAQRVHPGRQCATITGDGCFLMSAMELSTAARECLSVKFFILDDQTFHIMQALQKPAYLRTTATVLAKLDYEALARGFGVGYCEINGNHNLEGAIQAAVCRPGPVLVRVITDYGKRPIRWVQAAKHQFTDQLTTGQKVHFLARLGGRAVHLQRYND